MKLMIKDLMSPGKSHLRERVINSSHFQMPISQTVHLLVRLPLVAGNLFSEKMIHDL